MIIAGNWKMNLKYEDIINFKDIIFDFKLDKFFDAVRPPYKGNIEKVLQQLMK